jgi:uncharacterized membrane protein
MKKVATKQELQESIIGALIAGLFFGSLITFIYLEFLL